MRSAGRVPHHLNVNPWKADTRVFIPGCQGDDSRGPRLVNSEKLVSNHCEKAAVRPRCIRGVVSMRAGQADLLTRFSAIAPGTPRVVPTHGEDEPRQIRAQKIQQRCELKSALPGTGETIKP